MEREATSNSKYYRILSLDGGGSWAIIQARALYDIYKKEFGEDVTGHQVLRKFDYAGANSGGSIVLAALVLDWPLKKIIEFFDTESKREEIFVGLGLFQKTFLENLLRIVGIGPKYSTAKKRAGFEKNFGISGNSLLENIYSDNIKIGPFPDLLITSFDYYRKRAFFCRSDDKSNTIAGQHNSVSLIDAVHAASNAPVNYFNKPAEILFGKQKKKAWDGAVGGNNNPVLAIFTEVISNIQRYNPKNLPIAILSIGTSSDFLPIKGQTPYNSTYSPELIIDPYKPVITKDIKTLATSILQDPPDTASYIVYKMLQYMGKNEGENLVRLNPMIQPELKVNPNTNAKEWYLPGADPATGKSNFITMDQFKALSALDMDAVKQSEVDLINLLCQGWLNSIVLNQPIQTDSSLNCLVIY